MEKRKPLNVAALELISSILGDTNKGLTGTEIHRFLLQAGIKTFQSKKHFFLSEKSYLMLLQISKMLINVVIIS